MGIAKLYSQSGSGGKINGLIEDYYAYAGENISAGDFVEFINGVASQKTETSVSTAISSTTGMGFRISACKLSDTKVFIAHSSTNSVSATLRGIVCTIAGTKITFGTDTELSSVAYSGYGISTELLPNGNVFIVHSSGSSYHLYAMVCSVSGTTIMIETTKQLNTTVNSGYTISTKLLPNGNVFVAHSLGSNYILASTICIISGTTITAGTNTQLSQLTNTGRAISTCLFPNGNMFIAYSYGSDYQLYGQICTISGTTITKGTEKAINTSVDETGFVISTELLSTGKVFIAHSYNSDNYLYGMICTISGTTITTGTDTLINNVKYAGNKISTELLSNDKVFVVHLSTASYYLHGIICEINGTTITFGTDTVLNTNSYTANVISTLSLSNGTIFIAHCYSSNFYLYAQIWGIDETNNIPTNNVTIKEYETQVRKATTSYIYGVAKTKGVGGDSTGHKDIVSIYTRIAKGDIIPKTWTATDDTGKNYIAPDGTKLIVSSNASATATNLTNACDGDVSSYAEITTGFGAEVIFPAAKKITKIKTKFDSVYEGDLYYKVFGYKKADSTIYDAVLCNEIVSKIGQSQSDLTEYSLENTGYYEKYVFSLAMSKNSGLPVRVYEIQTTEYEI